MKILIVSVSNIQNFSTKSEQRQKLLNYSLCNLL